MQQGHRAAVPSLTPRLVWTNSTTGVPQHVIPTPFEGIDISMGASLTIEAWLRVTQPSLSPRPIILCGVTTDPQGPLLHFFAPAANKESHALSTLFRHTAAHKVVTLTSQNLTLLSATDASSASDTPHSSHHHIVLVVDGQSQIATYYVDGVLLDGGAQLGTGFFELAVLLKKHMVTSPRLDTLSHTHSHPQPPPHSQSQPHSDTRTEPSLDRGSVDQCHIGSDVTSLRVYGSSPAEQKRGYLRTSEVVASFLQGPPGSK